MDKSASHQNLRLFKLLSLLGLTVSCSSHVKHDHQRLVPVAALPPRKCSAVLVVPNPVKDDVRKDIFKEIRLMTSEN